MLVRGLALSTILRSEFAPDSNDTVSLFLVVTDH